jgi:hypothetical protein
MDRNLDYLVNEYQERMGLLKQAVCAGNCQSYEEYKYVCGQLRGLESACAVIVDLKQRLENSDEWNHYPYRLKPR